jgi:hypothetical protein
MLTDNNSVIKLTKEFLHMKATVAQGGALRINNE